jgi:hypothetical protein
VREAAAAAEASPGARERPRGEGAGGLARDQQGKGRPSKKNLIIITDIKKAKELALSLR